MGKMKFNEKGISLVEILASLVLFAIISMILWNITTSATKQNELQIKESAQIVSSSFLLKIITKDLRNTDEIKIVGNTYELTLVDGSTIHYVFENNTLKKDLQVIGSAIENFSIQIVNNDATVHFTSLGETYTTIINLRRGDFN